MYRTDHVIFKGSHIHCSACGWVLKVALPMGIKEFKEYTDKVFADHKECGAECSGCGGRFSEEEAQSCEDCHDLLCGQCSLPGEHICDDKSDGEEQ